MKKNLSICLFSLILIAVFSFGVSAEWNMNYTLTGNQAEDIANIAYAQLGKNGGDLGFGMPWCAAFVSACARKAGIPESVIRNATVAAEGKYPSGFYFEESQIVDSSELKSGDLIFAHGSSDHVFIYYNKGKISGCINGNNGSAWNTSTVALTALYGIPEWWGSTNKKAKVICYRPNYSNTNVSLSLVNLPSGTYSIRTLTDTNKALDINPNVTDSYIWDANSNDTQKWNIEPVGNYYKIINAQTGLALDVKGGTSASGIQVQQYKYNGTHAQLWQFFDAGNGNYYIRSALGYYLDLYGADTTNGNKIYVYDLNAEGRRSNQTWQLKPLSVDSSDSSFNVSHTLITVPEGKYRIVNALGNERAAIEISNGSKQKKGNAQLWQIHDGACQQWYLQKDGDYYKIKNVNSGLFLDVDDGKAQNGRNVWQWAKNKTNAQKWILEDAGNGYVYIKTALGDYYLDAQNAKSDNGTNIQIFQFNPAYDAQKFKLVRLDAPSYYFDVNGTLDGKAADLYGYGTVDVYIDGVLVADDVSDYYKKHPEGTRYEIKDIKALDGRSYDGVVSGSLSGTIVGGDTSVNLRFSTKTHTHTYSETRYEDAHPHKGYQICSCGSVKFTGSSIYNSSCSQCLPEAPSVYANKSQYAANETISLSWNSAVRADYYELKCINAATGNMDFVDWGVNGTSYELSLPAGEYNICVVSINNHMVSAGCNVYWNASKEVHISVVEAPKAASSCTLYYDANGGIEPPSPKTVSEGERISISLAEPSKNGYVFNGWSYNRDSNKADLLGGDRITLNSNTTIYAVWTKKAVKSIVLTIGSTAATVSGKTVYNDVAPLVVADRTMLPARFVAENLGAVVSWNGDNESVTIEGNNRYIELFVGSNLAKIDGETITLDSTPFIQNGRTYVPVRFISEALGANVEWVEALQQVIITA